MSLILKMFIINKLKYSTLAHWYYQSKDIQRFKKKVAEPYQRVYFPFIIRFVSLSVASIDIVWLYIYIHKWMNPYRQMGVYVCVCTENIKNIAIKYVKTS